MNKILHPNQPLTINFKQTRSLSKPFNLRQLRLLIFFLFISVITYAQTPNLYTPIINGTGPFTGSNLTVTSSLGSFTGAGNVIDNNSANSASMTAVAALTGGWIEVDYSNGPFPAGSEIGFVVDKGLLSLGLLNGVTITTYTDANPPDQIIPVPAVLDGTVAETRTTSNLLGVGLTGGREKIGFVTGQSFRRVRITFSSLSLGSVLSSIEVYNAEILVPQVGVLPPTCNTTTQLNQAAFPAVASYGTTSDISGGGLTATDIAGILNKIQNVENIVSSSTTDYANLSAVNVSVAGDGYLSVKLLSGSIPKDYYAGFEKI